MRRNRNKPLAFLALTIASCAPTPAQQGAPKMTVKQLRAERDRLAHRPRPLIFNNDGNEPVYYMKEATAEALLAPRTTPLVGSQVSSIFYCTWSSGFSYFTHHTKVGELFTTTANPQHPANKNGGFSRNKTAELHRLGIDPLRVMVDFAHQQGWEAFWSFRMNDTHDAWGGWYSDYLFPPLKRQHPEWLVGSKDKRPPHGGWTAVDYGRPEIRELAVRFIQEVCQNYDVDGIEMDFGRHALLFKGPAWGKDASAENLEQLTDMARQVRRITEEIGLRRGRPILVAIRVADSLGYCRAMGIDLERWLAEDLVDLVTAGFYVRLTPWQDSAALMHRYGKPVYAGLSETRIRDAEAHRLRSTLEALRARAAVAWMAGVDGIYMFNHFNPRSPLWRELGDPEKLSTLSKVYTTGARGVASLERWMEKGEQRFLKRDLLSPERPAKVAPGGVREITMPIAEAQTVPGNLQRSITVRVRVRSANPPSADWLSLRLNGRSLNETKVDGKWLEWPASPELFLRGDNRFAITVPAGAPHSIVVDDLAVHVTYHPLTPNG